MAGGSGWESSPQDGTHDPRGLDLEKERWNQKLFKRLQDPQIRAEKASVRPDSDNDDPWGLGQFREKLNHSRDGPINLNTCTSSLAAPSLPQNHAILESCESEVDAGCLRKSASANMCSQQPQIESQGARRAMSPGSVQRRHPAVPILPLQEALAPKRAQGLQTEKAAVEVPNAGAAARIRSSSGTQLRPERRTAQAAPTASKPKKNEVLGSMGSSPWQRSAPRFTYSNQDLRKSCEMLPDASKSVPQRSASSGAVSRGTCETAARRRMSPGQAAHQSKQCNRQLTKAPSVQDSVSMSRARSRSPCKEPSSSQKSAGPAFSRPTASSLAAAAAREAQLLEKQVPQRNLGREVLKTSNAPSRVTSSKMKAGLSPPRCRPKSPERSHPSAHECPIRGGTKSSAAPGMHKNDMYENGATVSPQCAAQVTSLSDTLHEAAMALRRIVPTQSEKSIDTSLMMQGRETCQRHSVSSPTAYGLSREVIYGIPAAPSDEVSASIVAYAGEDAASLPSVLALSPGRAHGDYPSAAFSPAQLSQTSTCGIVTGSAADYVLAPTIQRLVHENATLREAFNDASRRLSRLEDDKWRFFDEGVFDLVNSVCAQSGCGQAGERSMPQVRSLQPPSTAPILPVPVSLATASPPHALRLEEEKRSAELSGENEELRLELARASEVGEALEQQHQAAEDRMLALEQEQAWLAERLAQCAADAGTDAGTGADALQETLTHELQHALPCAAASLGSSGIAADLQFRRQLEDMNHTLRAELDAARQQTENHLCQAGMTGGQDCSLAACTVPVESLEDVQRHLREASETASEYDAQRQQLLAERAALDTAQSRLTEEMAEQREDADRIISDLDGQTQLLERRLRDAEAQAQALAAENAKLQAALGSSAGAGTSDPVHESCPAGAVSVDGPPQAISSPLDLELDEAW